MRSPGDLQQELDQRTLALNEALERQAATAEILQIIASSPTDTQPVFEAIVRGGLRLFTDGAISVALPDGDRIIAAAVAETDPARAVAWRNRFPFPLTRDYMHGIAILDARMVDVPDVAHASADVAAGAQNFLASGYRAISIMPMMRGDTAIGALSVVRLAPGPLSDEQLAVLRTFAAQAVIAIENTRFLNELRQRTEDLSESLEQQTAISDILRVISSSGGDVAPVFQAVARHAAQICEADIVDILVVEDGELRYAANHGEFERMRTGETAPLNRDSMMGRSIIDRQPLHIADLQSPDHDLPLGREFALRFGHRTTMAVPLLREDRALGTILVRRGEVRPFEDKHVALLKTFADQAAIAIANARLLNEVREQATQLEAQSQELRTLNQQLEQRVDEQVGEIERMGRLRRFLPPQVADLIVSSGAEKQLESHRREITALFCDLRGFTGFSETSDPEDVMALLREYHKAIGEIIFRHGGTLERFAGDGVMVIFGDPVPLENPALAAVQMALEMRAAIGTLVDKWSRLGHELGFGIGISHGYATLGTIGFEGRFDYAAIGMVSNVASRLCDEARPGQILISPRVLMAVGDAVSLEPVAEMALKGIRRPLLVHNVLDATAVTRASENRG